MPLTLTTIPLTLQSVSLTISTLHHNLSQNLHLHPPILFLHGFGSSKEDLADIALHPHLKHHPFLSYDAPGTANSTSSDLSRTSIPFLAAVASALLSHFRVEKFHLIGHSMGGLTALLLAHQNPSRVLTFINIKGNLTPEDCFLSRQIHAFPSDDEDAFLEQFIQRCYASESRGSAMYASTLGQRVRAGVVRPIFESMVEMSDGGELVGWFLGVGGRKVFMYGEENRGLGYLGELERGGVELVEIGGSGHFPMYSNPVEMWRVIAGVLGGGEGRGEGV